MRMLSLSLQREILRPLLTMVRGQIQCQITAAYIVLIDINNTISYLRTKSQHFFIINNLNLIWRLKIEIPAAERRRREEGWNDLGLDQIDANGNGVGTSVPTRMTNQSA